MIPPHFQSGSGANELVELKQRVATLEGLVKELQLFKYEITAKQQKKQQSITILKQNSSIVSNRYIQNLNPISSIIEVFNTSCNCSLDLFLSNTRTQLDFFWLLMRSTQLNTHCCSSLNWFWWLIQLVGWLVDWLDDRERQWFEAMPTRTTIPTVTWASRTRLPLAHREVMKQTISLLAVVHLQSLTMRSSKPFHCKTCCKINR